MRLLCVLRAAGPVQCGDGLVEKSPLNRQRVSLLIITLHLQLVLLPRSEVLDVREPIQPDALW